MILQMMQPREKSILEKCGRIFLVICFKEKTLVFGWIQAFLSYAKYGFKSHLLQYTKV